MNMTRFQILERKPPVVLKLNLTSENITREDMSSAEPVNPLNSIVCDTSAECVTSDYMNRLCVDGVCQCLCL